MTTNQNTSKGDEFMAAMRGIPGHHIAQVLTAMTPAVHFSSSYPKSRMATTYENANDHRWTDSASRSLRALDLEVVSRRARARMAGDRNWRTA